MRFQQGIAANDFFGAEVIGLAPAESRGLLTNFNEWYPLSDPDGSRQGRKRTACGKLVDYHQTGDPLHVYAFLDNDYDLDISPAEPFLELITRASDLGADWHDKIHAEIFLPGEVNPSAFSTDYGDLESAEGQGVCVYGPWVVDDNRAMKDGDPGEILTRKVEIHPAQQIWLATPRGALLLATADYSHRYDRRSQLDLGSGSYLGEWSNVQIPMKFAVAFALQPNDPPLVYTVRMTASDHALPASDGWEHDLVLSESGVQRRLVSVLEEPWRDVVSVDFVDVARRDDGTIQGFVTLTAHVGEWFPETFTAHTCRRSEDPVMQAAMILSGCTSGGHLGLLVGRGLETWYRGEVVSIKRLANNSFTVSPGVVLPPDAQSPGYDERLAAFSLRSATGHNRLQLSLGVGETRSATGFLIEGQARPFGGVWFNVSAADQYGNHLGSSSFSTSSTLPIVSRYQVPGQGAVHVAPEERLPNLLQRFEMQVRVTQVPEIEDNVDRPGGDFREFVPEQPEASVCRRACAGNRRCWAWTYVKPGAQGPHAACRLKAAVPQPMLSACCTSGLINQLGSEQRQPIGIGLIEALRPSGEFYATDGSGGMESLSTHAEWRPSWGLITPGNFGGGGHTDLLFYDPSAGVGEFYTTDGHGNLGLLRTSTGWRPSWNVMVPGNFGGDGHTDLLFYDRSGGVGEFFRTDGNGNIVLLKTYPGWRTSWSSIIPGNFGGDGHTDLLFYDATAGVGEFYTTDGHGNVSLLKTYTGWRTSWSLIIPGNFGGSGHTDLLFYDAAAGVGEFYTTDGHGNLTLLKTIIGWRPSWSAIIPGNFGGSGHTDLLFYDRSGGVGVGEFYTTDGHGNLALLRNTIGWRPTWSLIIPGNFGGSGHTDLLFYESSR